MGKELTPRQREILDFIREMIQKKGFPPTIREIGEKFKINSTNGVRAILSALIRKGYIRRQPLVSRGIELAKKARILFDFSRTGDYVTVPLLGRIAAGLPTLAVENIEGSIAVDRSFLPGGDVFSLKVQGESMKDSGIFDGDYVLARMQSVAEKGDIVVAVIGEEATVKKYVPLKKGVKLEPANRAFKPIVVDPNSEEFRIAGKVIGLLRKM
ncbi:MAG: transcriptional repressor LexA [candidate division Zixibacteria bacterium]|nr:transcriptional repressor LexA [candidate division Zixibacteria bacterium]